MIFEKQFRHRIIRNLIVCFGTIFNDISIERYKEDGTVDKSIKVPLAYGPKNKWIARLRQEPTLEDRVQFVLPRMGFSITNLEYDPSRQLIPSRKRTIDYDATSRKWQFNPVPYNVQLSLFIMADLAEDITQIVEQILPYFTPELTLTLKTIPEMDTAEDVPIVYNGIEIEDTFEGSFEQSRSIIWTLNFTAKINFYGPVNAQHIIRKVIADLYAVPGTGPVTAEEVTNTPRSERITTLPDPINALPGSDYGFSQTIEFFTDNMKRDPADGIDKPVPGTQSTTMGSLLVTSSTVIEPEVITS